MFKKILIANRGEIAVRVMRTCKAMGIRTVAVYSEADASAMHVRLADEAVLIGGAASADSYLRGEKIIQVTKQTGAEAIHPGYGFLSENANFAREVRRAGLVFIGPTADAINQMGSKTGARQLMQNAGVPIVPGYQGRGGDLLGEADRIGYPVLIKAAAGGGGKGMRVVNARDQFADALESAQREAAKAFGDDTVFLEKYLPVSHHIEFQVLADRYGNTVHLFERECSIQRRHQKIVEETPSPLLDTDLREKMGAAAVAAAKAVNYENAGTIEFIVDDDRNFYFLEMNTRLQVEHPVTEMVTGLDLVRLQLMVAAGEKLPFSQADLIQRGHAIECRIYAEDPANEFLPAVGSVLLSQPPLMPNVRIDTGIETGDTITTYYDPMIAKLITYGMNRQAALEQMQMALDQYILLGLTTNTAFLKDVMANSVFQSGYTATNFIEQNLPNWQPAEGLSDIALIAAAFGELTTAAPVTGSTPVSGADMYSPWNHTDGFRVGE